VAGSIALPPQGDMMRATKIGRMHMERLS
jgi:hypothetical protein